MKLRHVALLLFVVLAVAGGLIGCDILGSVTIDQRVTDFETVINSADRSTAWENFHPSLTQDVVSGALAGYSWATLFPLRGTSGAAYAFTITDQNNPTTGVFVTVTGGPAGFGAPKYLKLTMDTTGFADYRIVSLEISATAGSFPGPADIK